MEAYIVTGTPATGKTTFAKNYAKEHNIAYIDGKELIKTNNLSEGFDKNNNCDIIDENKFAKVCEDLIKLFKDRDESLIIDSHLSHYINSELIKTCFVTECDLKILNQRLKDRKYNKNKIKDNLEAETFKICQIEAQENGHTVEIIKTD